MNLPLEPLRPPTRSWAQASLIVGALFLWAWLPLPTWSAPVWAYLVLWVGLAAARGRHQAWAQARLPTSLALVGGALLLALSAITLVPIGEQTWANEQLGDIAPVWADRQRLIDRPAIHPPTVRGDRPQAFWIACAPDTAEVRVQFGPAGPPVAAHRVGDGRFRLAYDPRVHGPPDPPSGPTQVILHTDGDRHVRPMFAVEPRARPTGLIALPGGARAAAVSEDTDALWIIGGPGEARRVDVGDGPIRVVATSSHSVAVAHRHDRHVWRIDLATDRPERLDVGPGQADLAALDGHLAVIRGPSRTLVTVAADGSTQTTQLAFVPSRVFYGPDPDTLVIASHPRRALWRLRRDGSVWREDGPPIVVGRPVAAGVRAPRGARLHLAVSDYLPDDGPGANHQVRDLLLTLDVRRWRIIAEQPTFRYGEDGVDSGASPVGLAFHGATLLAALSGSDTLWQDGEHRPSPLPTPTGFVALASDRFVVTSAVGGAITWIDSKGELLGRVELEVHGDPHVVLQRRGERAFFEATRSGASCQTCHLDSDSDHAWHDIGHQTPRPTLSVRGIHGTAPYLRGASYPTLAGLDVFARTILGDYTRAQPDRAIALASYLRGLAPVDSAPRFEPDAEAILQVGLRAFDAAGCPGCHPAPAFTNLAQYPAQILFEDQAPGVLLDTPSLLGVARTPPYLFDGRAEDLTSVFERHDPGRRHGRYSALSERQKADLIAFLERL